MQADLKDVRSTVGLTAQRYTVGMLPAALLVILCGLVILSLGESKDQIPAVLAIAIGVLGGVYVLYRRTHPGKPLYVLAPAGITIRIPWVKEFVIPWSEINSLDSTEISAWVPSSRLGQTVEFKDVTVACVSEDFYKRVIYVANPLIRGPGWKNSFVSKPPNVAVAIHHELLSLPSKDLRKAIELRWRAFRNQAPQFAAAGPPLPRDGAAAAARSAIKTKRSLFARRPAAASGGLTPIPLVNSRWEAIKIILPLAGIVVVLANMTGLWQTAGQQSDRIEREKWAAQAHQDAEERQSRNKQWDDFKTEMDRAFDPPPPQP